eukprot:CAMPEP_0184483132 /NCGR_PEP_ID=MMETSP0113_2-20130426/4747_1 /TAXON_ID=91329 /ORGANISM="Norrisiella sphaerica, Strain BC52" /LENGTH=338 /DNA_ID=CAMNT_0026863327 /DNA_START=187 /DNA_END=1203 /DNA_ORIENTATION=-
MKPGTMLTARLLVAAMGAMAAWDDSLSSDRVMQMNAERNAVTTSAATTGGLVTEQAVPAPVDSQYSPITKFVILTTARSGSTWLGSIFQAHPQMVFHVKECLADDSSLHNCAREWGVPSLLGEGSTVNDALDQLLPAVFQTPKNLTWKSHVGFKWMTTQRLLKDPDAFQTAVKFLKANDVKIVALRRENTLRKCVSLYDMDLRKNSSQPVHKLAEDSSTWGSERLSVPVDYYKWCLNWFDKNGHVLNEISQQIESVHVRYRDLCNPMTKQATLDRIHNYLHVKMPIQEVRSDMSFAKIHKGGQTMSELTSNWDQVREELLQTSHRDVILNYENDPECA